MKNILLVLCPPVWHKLPPLGLAYISEYLKFCAYNVDIIDLNIENIDILDIIDDYDCVGFSIFKSNQDNTLSLVKKIREKNNRVKIILGGPQSFCWQFTGYPEEIKYVDSIIIGDALPSLSERPFPTFNGFKLSKYERKRALPILASRGCIKKCMFCSERLLSKDYHIRPPREVIKEIRFHKKTNRTKWFTFHDSLINGDLKQLDLLCDLFKQEEMCWDAQAVIRQDMTEGLLAKIVKSGCFNLFIGMESGSDRVLKLMNKGITAKDAEIFFKKCKSAGLHFEISLIVNFPGETEKEFMETLNFIYRNKHCIPKIAQINPFIRYPGTSLEQTDVSEGLKKVDRIKKVVEESGIKYTPIFINNLL